MKTFINRCLDVI
jgi:hypothetical protein